MISFGEYIIIALLAVILILQIFSMKSSPREGFQTAPTGTISFDPANAVITPNTCAIMYAIREQIEKNVNEAKQQNNTEIADQLTASFTELNNKITSMKC